MNGFEGSYAAWREMPGPRGSDDEDLEALRSDIFLADHWIAETLIPFFENGRIKVPPFDVENPLSELLKRAIQMEEGGREDLTAIARTYSDYVRAQIAAYRSFLTAASARSPDQGPDLRL